MLKATLIIEEDAAELENILRFEEKEFQNGRAAYVVKRNKGSLIIDVVAKDSVALRSALNTITKVITVHEKVKGALKNEISD